MRRRVKERRPACPRCLSRGFVQLKAPDARPLFKCDHCDHRWTCGITGGTYAHHARSTP